MTSLTANPHTPRKHLFSCVIHKIGHVFWYFYQVCRADRTGEIAAQSHVNLSVFFFENPRNHLVLKVLRVPHKHAFCKGKVCLHLFNPIRSKVFVHPAISRCCHHNPRDRYMLFLDFCSWNYHIWFRFCPVRFYRETNSEFVFSWPVVLMGNGKNPVVLMGNFNWELAHAKKSVVNQESAE